MKGLGWASLCMHAQPRGCCGGCPGGSSLANVAGMIGMQHTSCNRQHAPGPDSGGWPVPGEAWSSHSGPRMKGIRHGGLSGRALPAPQAPELGPKKLPESAPALPQKLLLRFRVPAPSLAAPLPARPAAEPGPGPDAPGTRPAATPEVGAHRHAGHRSGAGAGGSRLAVLGGPGLGAALALARPRACVGRRGRCCAARACMHGEGRQRRVGPACMHAWAAWAHLVKPGRDAGLVEAMPSSAAWQLHNLLPRSESLMADGAWLANSASLSPVFNLEARERVQDAP